MGRELALAKHKTRMAKNAILLVIEELGVRVGRAKGQQYLGTEAQKCI